MYGGIPKDYDGLHQAESRRSPRSKNFAGPRPAAEVVIARANQDPSYAIGALPAFRQPAGGEVDRMGGMVDMVFREQVNKELGDDSPLNNSRDPII